MANAIHEITGAAGTFGATATPDVTDTRLSSFTHVAMKTGLHSLRYQSSGGLPVTG